MASHHARWLALSNPELSSLISSKIGEDWITHEDEFRKLEPFGQWMRTSVPMEAVKRARKEKLVALIRSEPEWLSVPIRYSTCRSSVCTNTSANF